VTVSTVLFGASFEILLVAMSAVSWRTARSQRHDRRPSATLEHVGLAAVFTSLAVALPVVLVVPAASRFRSTFSAAILVLMLAGIVALAARKPLEWWEARSAAKLQAAAGIPTARPLVPTWAVVAADVAGTAVLVVVVFLTLTWVAVDSHWSTAQLVDVAMPTAIALMLVGVAVTAVHWWWQKCRIRRAALAHHATNAGYLGYLPTRPSDKDGGGGSAGIG
jgi:sterol desaturase/sphingolipid hydroxylase (fatty acid hydroxylase superfamily)